MSRPLLSLVGIVRNEAHAISRTFDSVRGVVDKWTLLDTGSTDGTQAAIAASAHGIPGVLHEDAFVDYATSRNQVLDLEILSTRTSDDGALISDASEWTLMMSADEVLVGGDRLRSFLAAYRGTDDAFNVLLCSDGEQQSPYPRVLKTGSPWHYEGVVHEIPVCPRERRDSSSLQLIPGVRIEHRTTDPERRLARLREYDLPKLETAIANPCTSPEWRARYMMFLGQTHEALADAELQNVPGGAWVSHMTAAMGAYMRRIELGGAAEEITYAQTRLMHIMGAVGLYDDMEMFVRLVALSNSSPKNPEIAYMIAARAARMDARTGMEKAVHAASLAEEATRAPSIVPVNRSTEWRAWRLAARCARAVGDSRADAFVRAGVAAGGEPEVCNEQ